MYHRERCLTQFTKSLFASSSGHGLEDFDRVALSEHPNAEVRILGDVVWVPPAEGPQGESSEMVGRTAQRDGRLHRRQAGEKERKPHGVLDGKPFGD